VARQAGSRLESTALPAATTMPTMSARVSRSNVSFNGISVGYSIVRYALITA
jgi:hypothetical protein